MKNLHSQPSRKFNLSLVLLLSLNLLPHLEDHMIITLLIGLVCIAWRFLYEFQKVSLPNFYIKLILVSSAFYLVYRIYGTLTGAEAATALLLSGISLKLVDSSKYHDAMIILFLNFLLLMARFLVSQSLPMTFLGVFNVVLITALLVQLHKGRDLQLNLPSLVKVGFKLLLQTAPLLVLLFFVFPRFSTGFFQLNKQAQAKSGFSPKLEPGSISKMVASNEVSFRVEFQGKAPWPKDRYWRGAVLTKNNGMSWGLNKSAKKEKQYVKPQINKLNKLVKQKIILEPRYGTWLFALDRPTWLKFRDKIKQVQNYKSEYETYSIKRSNGQKLSYEVYSTVFNKLSSVEPNFNLDIKLENDPRIEELVSSVLSDSNNEIDIKDAYLRFYRKNLKYTLEPPVLIQNTVSEFLFDSQRGFCEHLASSFAYLLRRSGIPARVVVGFHGGEKNDFGEHYTVRDKDAHAWVEMWSKNKKTWLRVDPTSVVAPLRIQLGGSMYHSLSEEEINAGLSQEEYSQSYRSSMYFKIVGRAQLAFDLAAMKWNQFLLDFDSQAQRDFLTKLGFKTLKTKHLTLLTVVAMGLFFLWLNRKRYFSRANTTEDLIIYRKLCRWTEQKGVTRELYFGPHRYLSVCAQKWPELERQFYEFGEIYQLSAYSHKPPSVDDLRRLHELSEEIKRGLKSAS